MTPRAAGLLSQPIRKRPKEVPRHARIVDNEFPEVIVAQNETAHWRLGDDGGGPRARIEHRDLAEEFAWLTPREGALSTHDSRGSVQDHEEGLRRSALADDDIARLIMVLVRALDDLAQLSRR